MYERAVEENPWCLKYVPDHLRTKKMCIKAVKNEAEALEHIPEHFKTREMCIKTVEREAESLEHVLDLFKTGEMCKRTIEADLYTLVFCPDWFITQGQTKSWHDDDYDDEAPEWYDGYKKRKAQKVKIKGELLPTAWHPSRWWDWCVPNDEKQRTEKIVFDHLIC